MAQFRFKACTKCGGDLAMDDGDWICLQCGTYYYVGLYRRSERDRYPRPWPPAWTKAAGDGGWDDARRFGRDAVAAIILGLGDRAA